MATNGNDLIQFIGQITQLSFTMTNPYSSKSYMVDDEYNLNSGEVYDGMAGRDTMSMTNEGDALFLNASNPATGTGVSVATIISIETFQAGDGGDIINLADESLIYGNVNIFGGEGDDILWSNTGNDFISGADGDDIIDGGPGFDSLIGGNDDDQIFGGEGDDFLDGGAGNDILYGGTDLGLRELDKNFNDTISFPDLKEGVDIVNLVPPGTDSLGIGDTNLSVDREATAEITFLDGRAGYNNTLAIYEITDDGTIQNVQILWGNVKDAGKHVTHEITIPTGEDGGDFGFFIIANGGRINSGYNGLDLDNNDNVQLVFDYGGAGERLANINDSGNMITTVYNDGITEQVLNGPVYHTTPRDGSNALNADGKTHVVSGLAEDGNGEALRIGFEDLPNLGDADYEDVLFDLDIQEIHVDASETGNDTIVGGAGDDIIYGEAGDDFLVIGNGMDTVVGGAGRDTIQYDVLDTHVDTIVGFDDAFGGDRLILANILDFDSNDDALDFVQLLDNADGDTELQVDANGLTGGADFTTIAVFEGGIDATLTDLLSTNSIVL